MLRVGAMTPDAGPVDPGHAAESEWLPRWELTPVGDAVTTASSTLTPVRTRDGAPAMLKLSHSEEETRGAALLDAWDGHGAVRVLRRQGDAVLIERAEDPHALVTLVENGEDDAATRILCRTADTLHAASDAVMITDARLRPVPLEQWFRELFAHEDDSDLQRRAATLARRLLAEQREVRVLHGDLHHGNVLHFGDRGWLAIDPKGLVGDRAFDFCNLLCNPSHEVALRPGRLEQQFRVVTDAASLDAKRLADWLVAWCALSSTWFAIDGADALAASAARIGEHAMTLVP